MSLEALLVPGFYTRHISVGLQTIGTAPTLQTATIRDAGDSLQLVFDRDVVFGAGGNTGLVATMSGGAATLSYSSGEGSRFLVYTWSRTIAATETGTLAYTNPGNGFEDEILLNDVANFSGVTITIGSEASFNDPTLVHNETSLNHARTTLRHNRTTTEHND